jgi:peptide/nickel transport system substrate-binding protein
VELDPRDAEDPRWSRKRVLQGMAGLAIASPLATFLAACGGDSSEADATSATSGATAASAAGASGAAGALKVLPNGSPTTFDPARWTVNIDHWALACLYEGLISFKPGTMDVVNQLAERFEPSADGLQYEFELKKGIQFHGGYGEVTAEDVKYSFERIAGLTTPKELVAAQPDWGTLREVKVTGTHTGTIILDEFHAPLMTAVLPLASGYIVSKKAVLERGEKFGSAPIGTGPYEMKEYIPGQRVLMSRFGGYSGASSEVGEPPQWDTIEIVLSASQTGDVALEAGDVGFAVLPLSAVDRLQGSGIAVSEVETVDFSWLNMNILAPKLADINIRKAIRAAIDTPGIIEAAWYGKWKPATAAIAPNVPIGYWPDAPKYARDLDQARAFMAAAGTESLDLTLTINVSDLGATEAAEIIQANLAEIGINVEVVREDSSTFYTLNETLRQRELALVNWTSNPDPVWATQWFTCEQFDTWNWMYMCNESFDGLHREALLERDPEKRTQLYIEMQKLWDEAAGAAWLAWPVSYFGHAESLKPSFTTWGNPILWNFR